MTPQAPAPSDQTLPSQRPPLQEGAPGHEPVTAPSRTRWHEHPGFSRAMRLSVTLLEVATLAFALVAIGRYLRVALSRIAFPFDLEWMEGSVVDHVARVLEHGNVYVEPSLEFTPFIYNPVYYYVSALVAAVVGLDYWVLRAVSLSASLVSFALLFVVCRKETSSKLAGAVAAGLFAATYALSDAWFDIARVDSLAITFCLLALYCVRFGERRGALALGGACAALAFGTKQSFLPIVPLLLAYLVVFEDRRKAAWFCLTSIGLSALSLLVLHVVSDGWHFRYVFALPGGHDMGAINARDWQLETAGALIFALPFALYFLLGAAPLKLKALYGAFGVTLAVVAFYSRVHGMSHVNVNMPAHVAVALLTGIGLRPFVGAPSFAALIANVALLIQFELLRYDPKAFIPTRADRLAAEKLKDIIRRFDGEVYSPHHGFVTAQQGRGTFAHDVAVYDVERSKVTDPALRGKVRAAVEEAIAKRRFAAILLDYDSQDNLPGLHKHYRPVDLRLGRGHALRMRVGLDVRPSALYVRRGRQRSAPSDASPP